MSQERLTMRKIKEILRLKWEAGLSNRAIARACKVSSSTVSLTVRRARIAGLAWPLPDELGEAGIYQLLFPKSGLASAAPGRQMPEWAEVRQELSKRGVTLKLLWQEYRENYPDGYGYTQYCEHYQRWSKAMEPSMRRVRIAGEELEVDYAGVRVPVIDPESGESWEAQIFVATLGASGYTYAEAQHSQELEHWIGGHVRAFAFFGGVPKILRPDNLRSGVKKANYYEPDLNPSYQEMALYYQVVVLPARPHKPKDKPKVENGVQNVERWVLARLRKRTFFNLAELNQGMRPLLKALNERTMQHLGKSRRELFVELDQPALQPLPAQPYEFAEWKAVRVSIDYHVAFDKHFYSVPYPLRHSRVEVRATERTVEIFHQGKQVAIHPRSRKQGGFTTCPAHMPSHHRFVAGISAEYLLREAQVHGSTIAQLIQAILASRHYPEQAYRTCLGVLNLSTKYPASLVEQACQRALQGQLLSYGLFKAELEALANLHTQDPLPIHDNIRGSQYYQ
jgi:transposase